MLSQFSVKNYKSIRCPTAHYWRRNPQIIFGGFLTPIVRYFLKPQDDSGDAANCCSFISEGAFRFLK